MSLSQRNGGRHLGRGGDCGCGQIRGSRVIEGKRKESRGKGESGAEVVGEREPREGGGRESATLRCVKKGRLGPPEECSLSASQPQDQQNPLLCRKKKEDRRGREKKTRVHTSGVLIEFHPLVAQSQESNQGFSVFQSLECSSLQMVPLHSQSTATSAWVWGGGPDRPLCCTLLSLIGWSYLFFALFRDTVALWFRFKATV